MAPSSVTLSPNYCHSEGNEDPPLDRPLTLMLICDLCLILTLSLAVLHNGAEDCLQQDEFLFDRTVWCRNHVVSGLYDTTDTFTDSAHLIHHLDGRLMASGETAHEKRL